MLKMRQRKLRFVCIHMNPVARISRKILIILRKHELIMRFGKVASQLVMYDRSSN